MSRLILVSNRLPVTVKLEHGEVHVTSSAGGLATGLRGPHERSKGLWIGFPGDVARFNPEQRAEVERRLAELHAVPLYLSSSEISRFYEGFSNGVLWPVFHYLIDRIPLDSKDWESYRRVNERFAELVIAHWREGDTIWIHDYQLMLVPALVRKRIPNARIGFFLHIPFPSSEVFRVLPQRTALLEGLLGADLIGFHTLSYVRHFAAALLLVLGSEVNVDRVFHEGREIRLGAFPMSIDAETFSLLAQAPDVLSEAQSLRQSSSDQKIILGVDRLDYTKGIPRRLLAMERLLEREPSLRGRVRFIQVAVPSRTKVEAYQDFRRQVDEILGRVNGAYATPHNVPIHYLYRSYSERQLVALYRVADVMLVTPLRDGMNLVAKEFIASRSDEDGVLVLSELAGAASELGESLLVNPYDIDLVAATLKRALAMPEIERKDRMRALRQRVMMYDVRRWVSNFLEALEQVCRERQALPRESTPLGELRALARDLRHASRLLLLIDYDGTVVSYANTPAEALPDEDLCDLLRALADRPGVLVHVLSGRSRDQVEQWLGRLPIGLHAEYGFWSRSHPDGEWVTPGDLPGDWKAPFLPIVEQFASRTPGSFVEEKAAALTWHYRKADAVFAALQAKELQLHLGDLAKNAPVEIVAGEKVVEIRLHGMSKGKLVGPLLAQMQEPCRVVALGDDITDEELFAALPSGSVSIHVGPRKSRAPFRVAGPPEARAFLRMLLD